MNDKGTVNVSAGVIVKNGRILIARRNTDSHLGGFWEFPGGKRRSSETPQDCVVRETREELGIDVAVVESLCETKMAYPDRTVKIIFFLCRWRSGEPRPIQCAELKWILPAELSNYTFPKANDEVLKALRGYCLPN